MGIASDRRGRSGRHDPRGGELDAARRRRRLVLPNVAAKIRSSDPSIGARPTYSTRTHAVPLARKFKSCAALVETSMMRLPWYGPRSLMRTINERPFDRFVTRT